MTRNERFFNSPVFESLKSKYACRYKNKFEFKLMKRFEAEPKIRSFYQPLLVALVKNPNEEKCIYVDFWIEYVNGKIDLLFVEKKFFISDQAEIYILSNTKELMTSAGFGFATINQELSKFRRISSANLKIVGTANIDDYCFVNFSWIN